MVYGVRFLYLHGLASGPTSTKAQFFRQKLQELDIELLCPDLNWPNFQTMTLSHQLQLLQNLLGEDPTPVTVIGSSLGGLLAVLMAIQDPRVTKLCLMAPAFQFLPAWLTYLGPEKVDQWQDRGHLELYHYAYRGYERLDYGFVTDAQQHDEERLTRALPILILHGRNDTVVAPEKSVQFAKSRPYVRVVLLDDDHGLGNVLLPMWSLFVQWVGLAVQPEP